MEYMVVGLGNPGNKYCKNRHNVGFLFIDFVLNNVNLEYYFKSECKSFTKRININSKNVILVKPQTFMNLSGEAVLPLIKFYKISPCNLIIIHDDIDLPFGKVKCKFSGSNAGHNGLKSIDQKIGNNYHRIRIGVGRPTLDVKQTVADYVLSNFTEDEQKELNNKIFTNVFNFVENIINEIK